MDTNTFLTISGIFIGIIIALFIAINSSNTQILKSALSLALVGFGIFIIFTGCLRFADWGDSMYEEIFNSESNKPPTSVFVPTSTISVHDYGGTVDAGVSGTMTAIQTKEAVQTTSEVE